MKRLKPNTKVIALNNERVSFQEGKEYVVNSDGFLIDGDGQTREILSQEDDYFFVNFKYVDHIVNEKIIVENNDISHVLDHGHVSIDRVKEVLEKYHMYTLSIENRELIIEEILEQPNKNQLNLF